MAVREPGEHVRPRQRARVGIGNVDLGLRDQHQQSRQEHGHPAGPPAAEPECEAREVHLRGLQRVGDRQFRLQHDEREKRPASHLGGTKDDPARPGRNQRTPPSHAVVTRERRHEAQEVHLFADLGNQRGGHRGGGAECLP
ncbi:hypothetical protein D3C86_1515310 [compost metagenome]